MAVWSRLANPLGSFVVLQAAISALQADRISSSVPG
jgi:hypothetical protein